MKRDRCTNRWTRVLEHKTFLMFFYNPSVRTRLSFEAAATELGRAARTQAGLKVRQPLSRLLVSGAAASPSR